MSRAAALDRGRIKTLPGVRGMPLFDFRPRSLAPPGRVLEHCRKPQTP